MKEALKLALEAFETLTQYNMVRANIFRQFEPTCTGDYVDLREFREKAKPAITAIKAALAQQADHSEQHLEMVAEDKPLLNRLQQQEIMRQVKRVVALQKRNRSSVLSSRMTEKSEQASNKKALEDLADFLKEF